LVVIALFAVEQGAADMPANVTRSCYVCNSLDEPTCKDVQIGSKMFVNPCPSEKYDRCRVISQDVEGTHSIFRSCATTPDATKEAERCVDRTGTARVKITYCECKGDNCNSATALHGCAFIVGLVALLLVSSLKAVNRW